MNDFFTWLNNQLEHRGWTYADLSRASGLSRSAISLTIGGRNSVTWEFCYALAKAFGIPAENVFREAGLLPPAPRDEDMKRLSDQAKYLTPANLDLLIDLAQVLYKRQEG